MINNTTSNINRQTSIEEVKNIQQKASNPNCSVWVNANAGTGKTKVLVDRILRLLLSKVPHNQILCITYTNAAAAEINHRIMAILSYWSYIEENTLITELKQIGISNITKELIFNARILNNQILDSNISLKIQTIHGFCQNLLESFFIEADMHNKFTLLEENHSKKLEINQKVFNHSLLELINNPNLNLNTVLLHFNERSLKEFITNILSYNIELNNIQNQYSNINNLKQVVFKFFNTNPTLNYNNYKISNCSNTAFNYSGFIDLITELQNNCQDLLKKDQLALQAMKCWLSLTEDRRAVELNMWNNIFFTTKDSISTNSIRQSIFSSKINKEYGPFLQELITEETKRLLVLNEELNNLQLANSNFELLKLALIANKEYLQQKQDLNFLDYNDLLQKTVSLLKKEQFIPWIFYKLNQSISHILVDEAQDTSPLQWEIIKIISKEIFSNSEKNKTIFIVGDLKQSIYSFQGAKPELLPKVKEYLQNLVTTSNGHWQELSLNTSFRSGKAVLNLVNQVSTYLFKELAVYSNENLFHACFNTNTTDLVEIWPVIIPISHKTTDGKDLLLNTKLANNNNSLVPQESLSKSNNSNNETTEDKLENQQNYLLAEAIAEKIACLISKEGFFPKDIMVLAAKRSNNTTLTHLIKLLKQKNIATSGLDKLSLNNHMAIMDILAIAKFLLQPLYSLNLATLLKTPIFNFNDNELTSIILDNNNNYLWHSLKENINPKVTTAKSKLEEWQKIYANNSSLLELFSTLFYKENIYNLYLNYFGLEVIDLFNEFINMVIYFENNNSAPTLEHFIYFLENINPTISKDLDNISNEVKLLTIHGSKGLEAKIVFLIDNTSNNNNKAKVINTGLKELPIIFKFSKNKGYSSKLLQDIINNNIDNEQEENKRLLYVALTRAKSRLYICSSAKDINKIESSTRFYSTIINSLNTNNTLIENYFPNKDKYGFSSNTAIIINN